MNPNLNTLTLHPISVRSNTRSGDWTAQCRSLNITRTGPTAEIAVNRVKLAIFAQLIEQEKKKEVYYAE